MWLGSYKKTKSSLSLYTPSHVPKNLSEIASSTHNMLKPLPFMRTQSQSLMCVDTKNLPIEEIDDFESSRPDLTFYRATRSLSLPILPPIPKTSDSAYKSVFLKKIKLCTIMCDFDNPSNDLTAKTIKEQTLQEINNTFIQLGFNTYTDAEIQEEMFNMVLINLKRPQKPFDLKLFFNADNSSYKNEDWRHMEYIYKILFNMVKSFPNFHGWNKDLIFQLIPLLSSKDPNEREQIVIFFTSYIVTHIQEFPEIFKKIDRILMEHRELKPDPCGVFSVLSIITRVILSNYHYTNLLLSIFSTQIQPLIADPYLSVYHFPLLQSIKIVIQSDKCYIVSILQTLVKYWPISKPDKEQLSLAILSRCIEHYKVKEDNILVSRIIGIVGMSSYNQRFTIAEEANKLIQTPAFQDLISVDVKKYVPQILSNLEKAQYHWSKSVRDLAANAAKFVTRINPRSMFPNKEQRIQLGQTANDIWVMMARKAAKNDRNISLGDKLLEISALFNLKSLQDIPHMSDVAFHPPPLLQQSHGKIVKPHVSSRLVC